jgi:hypothetical protein
MNKPLVIFTLWVALLFQSGCTSQINITQPITNLPQGAEKCIDSFDNFAFSTPDISQPPEQELILPSSPWRLESAAPIITMLKDGEVAATSTIGNRTQVWVRSAPESFADASTGQPTRFILYSTDTHQWQEVPSRVANLENIFVDHLIVTNDQEIFGKNMWLGQSPMDSIPALSKFNDSTKQFEVVQETEGILSAGKVSASDWYYSSPIVVDLSGTFWFFVSGDAVYSYQPHSPMLKKYATLHEMRNISETALGPDGSIYLYSIEGANPYEFDEEKLNKFDPRTQEMSQIQRPPTKWPKFWNILVDHSGRLWTGVYGWQEKTGEWKKFHPKTEIYIQINKIYDLYDYYSPPTISLESSDGRLWFENPYFNNVKSYKSGLAWYNPSTNEGCWFTTAGTNILEDASQTLWIYFNGSLYKLRLDG